MYFFNFTIDDVEEFRKQIDEIENKDSLYKLRNTLTDAKAIINQVRSLVMKKPKKNLLHSLWEEYPLLSQRSPTALSASIF